MMTPFGRCTRVVTRLQASRVPCVYFKLNKKLIHTSVITGSAMCTGMGQTALRLMQTAKQKLSLLQSQFSWVSNRLYLQQTAVEGDTQADMESSIPKSSPEKGIHEQSIDYLCKILICCTSVTPNTLPNLKKKWTPKKLQKEKAFSKSDPTDLTLGGNHTRDNVCHRMDDIGHNVPHSKCGLI